MRTHSLSSKRRAGTVIVLSVLGVSVLPAAAAPVAAAAIPSVQQDVYVADVWHTTAKWFDASEQVWKTIVLPNPAGGVVVAPDASAVYFSSYDGRAVYVVDPVTAVVAATIPLGTDAPWTRGAVMAVSPDSSTLFVTADNGVLTKIDTGTQTVTGSIQLTADGDLSSVVVSPDGQTVYAAGYFDPALYTVEAATMALVERRVTFQDPQGMQITPDGSTLLIGSAFDSFPGNSVLAAHSTADRSILREISSDNFGSDFGPSSLAISPDASTMYSLDANGLFSTIDVGTLATLRQIDLGDLSYAATMSNIAVTADGKTAVTAIPSLGVDFVDVATGVPARQTSPGETIFAVSIVPDQAPTARFTTTPAAAGDPTIFDASASSASVCPVGTYDWDFGDGSTSTVATPTVEHTYATAGSYAVKLVATTTCGTSTTTVFTGQTALRNGGTTAVATFTATITEATIPPTPTPTPTPTPANPTPDPPSVTPHITTPRPGSEMTPTTPATQASGSTDAQSLAATGADPLPLVAGGVLASFVGAALFMRHRRNSQRSSL